MTAASRPGAQIRLDRGPLDARALGGSVGLGRLPIDSHEAPGGAGKLPVLLADASPRSRARTSRILGQAGIPVRTLDRPEGVLRALLASGAGCLLAEPGFFGAGAPETLAELATHGIPILTFCDATDAEGVLSALRHGAFDVLVRPAKAEALVERVSLALAAEAARRAREESLAAARARLETLSSREIEIMYHISRGLLTKEIALVLGISQKTVEMFRGRILRKLDARGVADITRLWCAVCGPSDGAVASPVARDATPPGGVRENHRMPGWRVPTVEDRSSGTPRSRAS